MFIAGTSGIRDVPGIILSMFIAGTCGGGMHPALYWRGLLQVRLVEVCIQHYTGVVYCRRSGGVKPPALCCRCLLQVCLALCCRCRLQVCLWESVCLALYCRCVLQVRLVEGMYPVFLQDWLRVWPKEQLFVMRYEDYGGHERKRISEVLDFLGLGNQMP